MSTTKKSTFVYEADHLNRIIYIDVDSLKRAGQINRPEFADFTAVTNALPSYTIQTKVFPKRNKQTYAGLKIDVMQAFIIQHEDTIEKVTASLKELNEKRAEGLLINSTYGVVKSWFLDKYGKVYNNSALSKKGGKRDALIAELLGKVDPALIDPAAAQMEGGVCNG